MKIILILLDGLGDRSCKILNYRTPLQAANTPNLDRLARIGANGLYHASQVGECLPSETAHFRIFGYHGDEFPGRGLLEASGDNIPFDDEDVLCLAHLSGIEFRRGIPFLIHGRNQISGSIEEIAELLSPISFYEKDNISFALHQTRRNDAILRIKGNVSPHISDSDPIILHKPIAQIKPILNNPEQEKAKNTARVLNSYLYYCHRNLSEHPANISRRLKSIPEANFLVTQRCGRRIKLESFQDRWGLKGMLIASSSVYGGIANEISLTFCRVNDTNDPGKDLKDRINIALRDNDHDFYHVHTKVPDEAAHSGDPLRKRDMISSLDQGLGDLLNALETRDDLHVIIASDHSTPSVSKLLHSGEPVPFIMVGPNIRRDEVETFDEISAASGSVGLLRGRELMNMILNCSDRAALIGHKLGDSPKIYFSDNYTPFKIDA